jgi:hypothetical protein
MQAFRSQGSGRPLDRAFTYGRTLSVCQSRPPYERAKSIRKRGLASLCSASESLPTGDTTTILDGI